MSKDRAPFPAMKIRLKDVAARAGVAVNTASTILNRRPNSWASKATEARVFKAAEELGYRPNRAALGLRSGKFNTVALLIPDLHNPFYTAFADLLEVEVEKLGYDVLIESWRTDLERERRCLSDIIDRQVDGVAAILSDAEAHRPFLSELARRGQPFVALTASAGRALPVDSVISDFTHGLSEAVGALFELGHRHFAFLSALAKGQDDGHRPELFRRLLKAKGITGDRVEFARCNHTLAGAHHAAQQLLRRPKKSRPTGLLAMNDLSAIGAMRVAAEEGLSIPGDLSVVGVDDIPLSRFLPVSLSTIAQPIEEMARKTAEMLIGRIDDRTKVHLEQALFPTTFIRRESIGPAPK